MKAAIYARVSKEKCNACGHLKSEHPGNKACGDKKCKCQLYQGQDAENQLVLLRAYALSQGWETVEFVDYETGKHSDRAALNRLFDAASRREFGLVLVWALDRFTREGVAETFAHIKRLLDYGVQFESYTEAHFRTTGPAGELMIAIAAWIAKQERLRISERTKAGLARARAQGRVGGRPGKAYRLEVVREMRERKPPVSWREIGRQLEVPQSSLRKALNRVKKGVH